MKFVKFFILVFCLVFMFSSVLYSSENKPDQLVVWPSNEPQLVEFTEIMASQFEEEYGVKVVVNPLRLADQPGQLILDGPAGSGPDLFTFSQENLGRLIIQGIIEPLEGEVAISDEKKNSFLPLALEAMTYEGKMYGFPHSVDTYVLLYNKDLVSNPPETFSELKEIAAELTDITRQRYGFLYSAEFFYFNHCFLAGFGGYIFGQTEEGACDVEDIGLNNQGAQQGLAYIKSFFEEGLMPLDVNYDMADSQFMAGNTAMIISGPWAYDIFLKKGINLGVAPLPMLPNGKYPVSMSGARALGISYYSNNKEWAKILAEYMTSKEALKHRFEMTSAIPPLVELKDEVAKDPFSAAVFEQFERSIPMPSCPEMGPVWGPMDDAVSLVIRDETTIEEALDEAVQAIKESITEMR